MKALGYFFGDPAHDFANKEVLFMSVGAILPAYRGTRLFNKGKEPFYRCEKPSYKLNSAEIYDLGEQVNRMLSTIPSASAFSSSPLPL